MTDQRMQEQQRLLWWNFKYYAKRVLKWAAILAAVFFLGYMVGHEKGYHAGRHFATANFVNDPFDGLGHNPLLSVSATNSLNRAASRHLKPEHKRLARSVLGEDVELEVAVIQAWSENLEIAKREKLSWRSR